MSSTCHLSLWHAQCFSTSFIYSWFNTTHTILVEKRVEISTHEACNDTVSTLSEYVLDKDARACDDPQGYLRNLRGALRNALKRFIIITTRYILAQDTERRRRAAQSFPHARVQYHDQMTLTRAVISRWLQSKINPGLHFNTERTQ